MSTEQGKYIPALGYNWATSLYDPILAVTMREPVFRPRFVKQAAVEPGHKVLDLACGTGTLTILLKHTHPAAEVVGVDGDSKVLRIAQAKAVAAGASIQFDQSLSHSLPFANASFDRVITSLFFHHLNADGKRRTLVEVRRVLRPGGEFHLLDFGKPSNPVFRAAYVVIQLLDGFETTGDNVKGALPAFMSEAGFSDVRTRGHLNTMFGTLGFYSARA